MFLVTLRSLFVLTPPSIPLPDCDEVFNYYEPLHFLLYGTGLQTWEYAPNFALRTVAFLKPLQLVLGAFSAAISALPFLPATTCAQLLSKPSLFHLCRLLLSLATATAEADLYDAVHSAFSPELAATTLLLLAPSAGMYHAAAAFLPSSVALTLTIFCTANHIRGNYIAAIVAGLLAVTTLGWPFVAVLYVPLGVHSLYAAYNNSHARKESDRQIAALMMLFVAVFFLVFFSAVVLLLDIQFYGRATMPNLNIFLYNAVGGSTDEAGAKTGDELYGVEPASYYVKNLLLNFSGIPMIAAAFPAIYFVKFAVTKTARAVDHVKFIVVLPLLLWFALLFSRPHKEERFLFPVYHLIAFSAALTLDYVRQSVPAISHGWAMRQMYAKYLLPLLLVALAIISLGRISALSNHYSAPIAVYTDLYNHLSAADPAAARAAPTAVCVGGEWHRFPSHFFLPESTSLHFVESSFKGQLPQPFTEGGSKVKPPQPFNALNREEESRYTLVEECDYFIELLLEESDGARQMAQDRRVAKETGEWKMILSRKFLDAQKTSLLHRIIRYKNLFEGGEFVDYGVFQFIKHE
jgi:alpha-1,2-mannosyltransferase